MSQTQQLPLSSAWQNLGPGPLLVQVVSGSAQILQSATIPSASSTDGTILATTIGSTGTQFNGATDYWVKGVATGSIINATLLSLSTSPGNTGGDAGEQVNEIILLEEVVEALSVLGAPAQDGQDVTGAAMPAGGAGIRGWLSANYGKLAAIAQAITGTLKTAPQANAPRVVGSGALSAPGNFVPLAVDGMSTGVVQVTGTWSGTLVASYSLDGGTSFQTTPLTPLGVPGAADVAAITANGAYRLRVLAGASNVQLVLSQWISGSANVVVAAASGADLSGAGANIGAWTDPAATSTSTSGSAIAWLRGIFVQAAAIAATVANGALQVAVKSLLPRTFVSASLGAQFDTTKTLAANVTAGAALMLAVDTYSTASVQISGAWQGLAAFLASLDGGLTYVPVNLKPFGANQSGPSAPSATANGQWDMGVGTISHLVVLMTTLTSGMPTVTLSAAVGARIARVTSPANDPLPVLDNNNAAFTSAPTLPASGGTPGRSVGVICTAAGTIVLALSGGGSITLPVSPGWQTFPFAATGAAFASGAAGSVYNLS